MSGAVRAEEPFVAYPESLLVHDSCSGFSWPVPETCLMPSNKVLVVTAAQLVYGTCSTFLAAAGSVEGGEGRSRYRKDSSVALSDRDFEELREFVYNICRLD